MLNLAECASTLFLLFLLGLCREFDESLTELNWPFISGKVALASIPVELLASFRQQISLLLKLKP